MRDAGGRGLGQTVVRAHRTAWGLAKCPHVGRRVLWDLWPVPVVLQNRLLCHGGNTVSAAGRASPAAGTQSGTRGQVRLCGRKRARQLERGRTPSVTESYFSEFVPTVGPPFLTAGGNRGTAECVPRLFCQPPPSPRGNTDPGWFFPSYGNK